jgi:hypothetical protein
MKLIKNPIPEPLLLPGGIDKATSHRFGNAEFSNKEGNHTGVSKSSVRSNLRDALARLTEHPTNTIAKLGSPGINPKKYFKHPVVTTEPSLKKIHDMLKNGNLPNFSLPKIMEPGLNTLRNLTTNHHLRDVLNNQQEHMHSGAHDQVKGRKHQELGHVMKEIIAGAAPKIASEAALAAQKGLADQGIHHMHVMGENIAGAAPKIASEAALAAQKGLAA